MYNKHNLGKLKERIFITRALKGSIAALGVFVLAFTIIPVLIAEASAANSANLSVTWDTVTMVLDPDADAQTAIDAQGHGDIVFGGSSGITPVENNIADHGQSYGRLVVTKKRIGVATSGTFFSVYLSMDNNNSNSLIMANTNLELEAVHGTWDEPKTFTQNGGSGWGFAVPNTPIATSQDSWDDPEVAEFPDFSPSAASDAQLDTQISYNTDGATTLYANSVWTAVPTLNTPQQIWKESNETHDGYGFGTYTVNVQGVPTEIHSPHSDANDARYKSFDIYYAVAVDTNIVAGTYSNNIVYTGIAAASSLDEVSTNLVRDIEFGGENDVQTLRFDLNDSAASVTTNILTVALVPHSVFVGNNYTVEGLSLSDYDTCDITNFTRNTLEGYSEITCTMPMETPETGYGDGTYDYWINVDGYNYNYVSKISYTNPSTDQTSNVGAFVYAGLQTEYATSDARYVANKKVVTEMQEMTPGICDLTNMWKNTTSVDARIMDYNGLTVLASSAADSMALNLGTFALKDNRDSKDYLVRRLADGNCWMVQNLDLELADFVGKDNTNGGLTPENTDLQESGRSYWDPGKSAADKAYAIDNTVDKTDQTSYFPVTSENYLGQVQTKQFQTYDLLDWRWGTRCSNVGICNETSTQSSVLSRIPRSYSNTTSLDNTTGFRYIPTKWDTGDSYPYGTIINTATTEAFSPTTQGTGVDWRAEGGFFGNMYIGHYYNDYAALAESGYETYNDSICPKAWQLSRASSKSFTNLFYKAYGLKDNDFDSVKTTKKLPLSFVHPGAYNWTGGTFIMVGNAGLYWSSSRARLIHIRDDRLVSAGDAEEYGFTVRCVNKGSVSEPVVAACSEGSICYNGNGADTGSMTNQSAESNTDTTLIAPNFSRKDYGFAGWSTSATGYGETYGPNQTITTGDLSASGLQLYARWVKSSGTFQSFTVAQCSNLATNEIIALTDTRDGITYAVAKLNDGNCWTIENNRYATNASATENTMNYATGETLPSSNIIAYGNYYRSAVNVSSSCPDGWSAPTLLMWRSLYDNNTGSDDSETSNNLRTTPINYVFSRRDSNLKGKSGLYGTSGAGFSSDPSRFTQYYTVATTYADRNTPGYTTDVHVSARCVKQPDPEPEP